MSLPVVAPTLTDAEELFCQEYLISMDLTDAAWKATGYQDIRVGQKLLEKPHIQARILQLMTNHSMSETEIVYRLSDYARATVANFLSENMLGELTFDLGKALASGKMHQIREIKRDGKTGEITGIVLQDQLKALELLSKIYGMTEAKDDNWKHILEKIGVNPQNTYDKILQYLTEQLESETDRKSIAAGSTNSS